MANNLNSSNLIPQVYYGNPPTIEDIKNATNNFNAIPGTYSSTPLSGTINSTVLNPQAPIPYSSVNPTPIPNVSTLETPTLTPTPTETQANSLTSLLESLNTNNVGQSTFRTAQETAAGLPELQKTQTDLASKLKGLQNEALAIPQQLQLEATGRGITTAGLQPIQTAALRNNAIQALGVSSLLDATNGLLTSAQAKVDRAVKAKFDPIQEQIDAATKNLDLILKSPQYSLEDKNRAQAQLDIQNNKANKLAQQKDNYNAGQAMAIAAVKNNPSDPSALKASQDVLALDPSDPMYLQKVFGLVGKYQSDPTATQKALDEHLQTQAQIDLIRANIQKANAETAQAKATTAQKVVSAADIQPNSREYRVAQDLAYGDLTFQQFRTLFAYSRDTNTKLAIYDLAGQLNPNFNPSAFELGFNVAKNPKIRQQVAALDNVQERLPDLLKVSNEAARTGIPLLNKIVLPAGYSLGGVKYSNFRTAVVAFADELSGALGFGSATDMSREMGFNMTDPNLSPEQFSTAMNDVVIPFIASKRSTLVNQFGTYANTVNQFSGQSNQPGTTQMTGPDGKTWTVPNDKVDLFRQNGYK